MLILGLEGTAWAASAACYDLEREEVCCLHSKAYQPATGGIHPREAAEHMREAIPEVIETALDEAPGEIGAVAFSRGPGLGPCLRTVGTAARTLAGTYDVPLIGVNHMLAHVEIGRHQAGFSDPLCLNASGANAHVLGLHDGRYRILGETMDTGVGNAIDKFTRHLDWSHPGGPKVEAAATDGSYHQLPYVVKGMDFSFSGIMSAAKAAVDDGVPVEDVCRGLEETIFAMLTEVTERALALTGRSELVLGGGVGQNERLQGMLRSMSTEREVAFHAPPDRHLRDNAAMIALLGAKMLEVGSSIPIEDSAVRPDYRPEEVPVTWLESQQRSPPTGLRGAEATITRHDGHIEKARTPRAYRHPALDRHLRTRRTRREAMMMHEARTLGVSTPVVGGVDPSVAEITMTAVGAMDLAVEPTTERLEAVGEHLATLHENGIVHGDPTVRNVRIDSEYCHLIDFGLAYTSRDVEDFAMDLHVCRQSILGTVSMPEPLIDGLIEGYRRRGDETVIDRLEAIATRGRYQ